MRFFGPGEYPYKTYAKTTPLESAASALSSLGYGAEALHNNGGNFYSRAKVYNNMGFDHYTSKEFMNILKTTPKGWATDDILVPNIMESLDTTDGTDFVCTISVQGHGDYPTEPTLENPEINVTGVEDEGKRNAWEYYVNEVHEMDKFVGQLIDAIRAERGTDSARILRRPSPDTWSGSKRPERKISVQYELCYLGQYWTGKERREYRCLPDYGRSL